MFVHWGLYSILGRGEWIMHVERIPSRDYRPLAQQFNPTRFDAEAWVALAADAGQKYMVITSRHHDGFSMYDTALSDYKVTHTPFKRDPVAELADVCARRGDVKLGFYSSLLDWNHPAYRYRQESGLAWADYLDFLHGQCANCVPPGEIAHLVRRRLAAPVARRDQRLFCRGRIVRVRQAVRYDPHLAAARRREQ
jgi:alpha-L-fucosidase